MVKLAKTYGHMDMQQITSKAFNINKPINIKN